MARKSRKHRPEVLSSEQTSVVEILPVAIYARLSVEDKDRGDEGSIRMQITICQEYIEQEPDLKVYKEYRDNGFTGTNMNRPGFEEMLEDIRQGKVKSVCVRDLSRFGRDYIETGTYIERIFPGLGIRFISVKEQFDTAKTDGSMDSLVVPLQNMINDLYAKDISKKIYTAFHAQMEKGEFKWRMLPYGYGWNETHTEIIPIEEEAEVVRRVYAWFLEGKSSGQIAGNPYIVDEVLRKVE